MENVLKSIERTYGNRLRVRVCGIAIKDDKILLVKHKGFTTEHWWAPPGGGVDFGEKATNALTREFQEETGLNITVGSFLFVHEYCKPPLHAIELFFQVNLIDSDLQPSIGFDPEMVAESQIITAVQWLSWEEIKLIPANHLHDIFQKINSIQEIVRLPSLFND